MKVLSVICGVAIRTLDLMIMRQTQTYLQYFRDGEIIKIKSPNLSYK